MSAQTNLTTGTPTPGTMQMVLVGATRDVTGNERLLAEIRDGERRRILIETHRPSNAPLLDAQALYVHDSDGVHRCPVLERRLLTDKEQRRFEAATPAPIGANLEVIELGPSVPPVVGIHVDDPGTELQTLSETRCWELLRHSSIGRLAVTFNGAPDIYPVNHAVIDNTIVIRTAPGTKLVAAIDHQVAFEVDHLENARRKGWSVVVRGTAEEPRKIEDYLTALDDGPTPWAAGQRDRFIVIRPSSVTGRVLPPTATGVALSSPTR